MDIAKDVVAKPFLTHYLKWEFWPYYLAAVLVTVLLLLLLLIFLRRRSRLPARFGIRSHVPEGLLAKQEQIPRSSLRKAWKRFLDEIPRQFRRTIQNYRPYIVFGESGSGKSLLIDNNTDWRGQANRFYPSYTLDPLLQIYLGSSALVMEVPAPLLNNTSHQARNALLKLWKPLFADREATVIIVLNAPSLLQELPENIRRHAEVSRGKINILSSVQKSPVLVHLVVSHMDQLDGYTAFADFLAAEGIPLEINPRSNGSAESIAAGLEPYENLLPKVLTSKSADDYLRIVSFFRTSPEIFQALSSFAKILQSPDPLSRSPHIDRVCLTSRDGKDAPGSDPFFQDMPEEPVIRAIPNLRHRLAAAVILALGLCYLGGVYWGERSVLVKADAILHQIDLTPMEQYEHSHVLFVQLGKDIKENSLGFFLPPRFFLKAEENVRERFIDSVRKYYLQPCLMNLKTKEDAQEGSIYLLGLYYATRHNELGKLVLANVAEFHSALNLSTTLVNDYVKNNERVEGKPLDMGSLSTPSRPGYGPLDNSLTWLLFFKKVQKACEEPSISKEYLEALQKEADSYRRIVEKVARYKLTAQLVNLLKRETAVGGQITWIQRRDVDLEQESLRGFFNKIKEKRIDYPTVSGMGLMQFIETIKTMAAQGQQKDDKEYKFHFSHENFDFTAKSWDNLILRSCITLFMREFLAQNKRTDGLLFFGNTSSIGYPDLVMNPSNDGLLFFTGKGKVSGKFTRSAFEQQVKPVLNDLPEFFKTLPIAEEEKKRFSQFILKQTEAYADHYVSSYRSYYSQFRLAADSLGGLRYLLKQIQLPTSPFQDFLMSIKDNTVLDLGESPYLRQFSKKLGTFEFIRRLMTEKEGAFPEFDKYKALIQQMDDELDGNDPFVVKNKADDANELKRILSPLGRISLGMQRGENDSYASMVKVWLKSVGMDAEWQNPFLDPVTIAFFLGRNDVQSSVDKIWSDLSNSYVKPLYSKFPFNRKTEVEITPTELERIIHPQGAFWKTFRDYLAPVCTEDSGFWSVRLSSLGIFRIPDGMFDSVNELNRLTSVLWSDKGVAKPIVIQIRPSGLPPRTEHAPIAILSYLRSDKSSVFAFNQQPAWQKLEIEWWKSNTSAVGVEFEALQGLGKSYREITISERFWSFHQLLGKAELIDKSLLVWRVSGPAPSPHEVRVGFTIKSDPWAVFRLNQ
ncbi:MAG: hypothetical protein AB9866_00750 [Syntrophobacteraceae bacterium]